MLDISSLLGKTQWTNTFSAVLSFQGLQCSSQYSFFGKCRLECQCISFNYWTTKKENNCELNYENRYLKPSELKLQVGAQYYDLVMAYNVVVSFTVLVTLYITHSAQYSLSVNVFPFVLLSVCGRTSNVVSESKDSSIAEEENFILYIISLRSA